MAKWKDTGKGPGDPEANKALDAHSEYWSKQRKAGRALLAGGMNGDYWDNVAFMHWLTNKFQPGAETCEEPPIPPNSAFEWTLLQMTMPTPVVRI